MYRLTHPVQNRAQLGFTLIEMMITVAIAAILASVATASYQSSIRKSRRTDARNAILDIAAREERYFSVNNSYSSAATDVGYGGTWPQKVSNGYYNVTVTLPAGTTPAYTVTATTTGLQVSDTACATFTTNQIGQQSAANSAGVDATTACWGN